MTSKLSFPPTKDELWNFYFPFEIALVAIFAICIIPLVGIFYINLLAPGIGLWLIAIPLSVANFLSSSHKKDPANTKTWDLIIMIMSVITLIPLLGWVSAGVGLGFSIHNLVKYNKRKNRF